MRPTYDYRRITALLNRRNRAAGVPLLNHKRIYRLMRSENLLLQKCTGRRIGRTHDGIVRTLRSNTRWCSGGSPWFYNYYIMASTLGQHQRRKLKQRRNVTISVHPLQSRMQEKKLTNRRPKLLEATAASERRKALGERFRRYPRSRTRSSRSNLPSSRALNPTRSACVETSTGGLPLSLLYSSTLARALSPFFQVIRGVRSWGRPTVGPVVRA